jgi:beta-lactamase class A
LIVFAVLCAGCASGADSVGLSGNARPTAALSATPRTLTWTTHGKGSGTKKPAATPSSTRTPDGAAEQLLTSAVAPLADQDDDHVAIAVADLSNGQFASFDGNQQYITASIAKADILATLLYQLQQENKHLNGDQKKLATAMIEESDNTSATKLYDEDGDSSGIDAANEAFGLTSTTAGANGYWGLTITTPADQVRLLRQIFTSQTILAPASQAYMQGLMSEVEPSEAWGVPSVADSGTSSAVKNGWLPDPTTHLWEVNSIGEVTHDGQHMLIAVLSTDNHDEADGISLIEDVIGKAANAVAAYKK